ncbi:hypothetical protein, partial [Novacetimonas hansenii]|uniref:hypothetical protein n=1 Tax=Novacetimonas hansenii TaxID=436 RepID=UPI0039ECBDEE
SFRRRCLFRSKGSTQKLLFFINDLFSNTLLKKIPKIFYDSIGDALAVLFQTAFINACCFPDVFVHKASATSRL